MILVLIFLITFFHSTLVIAESIPINYFVYQSRKLLFDTGEDWNTLTNFSPITFKLTSPSYFDGQIGFNSWNKSFSLNALGYLKYNKYYCYLNPLILDRKEPEYQDISIGLNHNRINIRGLGFENNWVTIQIGKGKESWGAGNDIQLALSDKSGTYDYFLLASDYGKIRVRYIYGFLENINIDINRYITARGFEWTNKKSLIIGFSETVIYSGNNRSFDLGYLNPMSSHLEIELNDRLNIIGEESSNAVWQIHIDYLLKKNLRISFNYLYDEFVFDPNIEIGKEHGRAYSFRLAFTPYQTNDNFINLYSSLVYVGTPTFRHGIGTNNFIQDGKPLGWQRGSDGEEVCIGMNYYNKKNLIINIATGYIRTGEESILERPYEPYSDYFEGAFPSGQIEKINYKTFNFTYMFKDNCSISSYLHLSHKSNLLDFKLDFPISSLYKW